MTLQSIKYKFVPDRFSRFDVYWKKTDKHTSYIYIYIYRERERDFNLYIMLRIYFNVYLSSLLNNSTADKAQVQSYVNS